MWEFCFFEIKYRLRHVSTYVFSGILVAITVLANISAGGLLKGGTVTLTAPISNKIAINSPFVIYSTTNILLLMAVFMLAAFVYQMFSKDFETKFYDILFCKPIKKYQYILGRLLGNILLMLAIMLSCLIAFYLSLLLPGYAEERVIDAKFIWYFMPFIMAILPNVYFMGALFIATVVITKKPTAVFGAGVLLYVMQGLAAVLSLKIENVAWSTLLDPFGMKVFSLVTKGWTADQCNTQTIGFSHYLVLNRLLWIAVGTVFLIISLRMFNFNFSFMSNKKRKVVDATNFDDGNRPATIFSAITYTPFSHTFTTHFAQCKALLSSHLSQMFKSASFYWITAILIVNLGINLQYTGSTYGTSFLPVTYSIMSSAFMQCYVYFLLIITFYTGELIYRARDRKFQNIENCLPVSSFTLFLSKYIAMLVLIAFYATLIVCMCIITQTIKGYYHFEIGVYCQIFLVQYLPDFLILLCVAFFIHNFVNHKYLGHFVFILTLFIPQLASIFHIEHNLLIPLSTPNSIYSDMSGFGANLSATLWFSAYWSLFAIILTGVTVMNWKTGIQQSYTKLYLKKLKTRPVLCFNITFISLALAVAGYIFYNTNIRHTFRNSLETERLKVQYEKEYKHFQKANQPKIQDIKVNVDLYSERREMLASGTYLLKNVGDTPIDTLIVNFSAVLKTELLFGATDHKITLLRADPALGYSTYLFTPSLAPQDTFRLNFEATYAPNGFGNNGSTPNFLHNGSFITSDFFPSLGYKTSNELTDASRRKYFNLPKQDAMPSATDPWGLTKAYLISPDADWIGYEITVSTSADQIAIAPGELKAQWVENGRNYYTYAHDSNVMNFYIILSARYEVYRDKYNDIDLEIYYHPDHPYNIENMMKGMIASMDYYTHNFSPYQFKVLRIAEVPRYSRSAYAQSLPTLIRFSENFGFIADLKPGVIEYPLYVTAHETAHQWWGHQVVGGFVRGSTMLCETFAEYSGYTVMKHNYSDKLFRKQLRYALDDYLSARMYENNNELPLVEVENQQYIHYYKGTLVMNAASRLISEDVVNTVLSDFVKKYEYASNPYPSSLDFMNMLDPFVPDSLKATFDDMFYKVVVYDHKVQSAITETTPDNRYKTTLAFTTEKMYYDTNGHPEKAVYKDWVEIALLDRDGDILHIEEFFVTDGVNIVEIYTDIKPNEVYIDPYIRHIDLVPHDNYMVVSG